MEEDEVHCCVFLHAKQSDDQLSSAVSCLRAGAMPPVTVGSRVFLCPKQFTLFLCKWLSYLDLLQHAGPGQTKENVW